MRRELITAVSACKDMFLENVCRVPLRRTRPSDRKRRGSNATLQMIIFGGALPPAELAWAAGESTASCSFGA